MARRVPSRTATALFLGECGETYRKRRTVPLQAKWDPFEVRLLSDLALIKSASSMVAWVAGRRSAPELRESMSDILVVRVGRVVARNGKRLGVGVTDIG